MTDEKKMTIHTSLDTMLENPKSKTFLNHLVRGYMPATNMKYLIDKPKGDFICVLTKDKLLSGQDVLAEAKLGEAKNDFVKFLDTIFDDKTFSLASPMAKLVIENNLGVTGKDTNTYMSFAAYQAFIEWVITKSLKGDKHINWLLGSIRRNTLIARAESIQDPAVQKKVAAFKKQESKVATYSLGDLGVLQNLKSKLEAEGR